MVQVLFLFGLYGFGLYFGLLFKRQIPCALIGSTGFLWGALFWVVGGILLQVLTLPYTPASMAILFLLLGIGLSILHARNKTWQLTRREVTCLLPLALVFLLVLVLASQFNFSVTSQDSIALISTGRRIAYEGYSSAIIEELSLRGAYLSQLQSASVFLGDDYLYAAQPAFAYAFALSYFYLSHRIMGHLLSNKRLALALSFLTSLVLFSTFFIVFQIFYIHNNLISAVYLFIGVSAFWLAPVEDKNSWVMLGVLALLGFSLARNEAPIFALIFLVPVISAGQIPYRIRLRSILPYLVTLILWYSYLLARMGAGTKILDPEKTLVIIGALAAFGILVIFSEHQWIKRFLLPHLPRIMLGALLLLLVLMAIQKPEHMKFSVYAFIKNFLGYGWWGITWIIFSFLLVFSLAAPRIPREEIFFYGITSFVSTLLALSYFRNPYRLGWGDSANRMFTHVLPILILYVLMKTAQGLAGTAVFEKKTMNTQDEEQA
jgi:hypothetical protein